MSHKNIINLTIPIIILLLFFSCSGGNMPEQKVTFPSIKDVQIEKWQKLTKKKIYFGHQSVGFNIMDGIKDVMKEHPEIKVNIVETADESDFKVGLLAHSRVGKNADPKSKITGFIEFIDSGIGKKADAAALKFCFVDIEARTDVKGLFSSYNNSITQIEKKYPDMTVIHFTEPLTTTKTTWKTWIKKMIRKKDIWEYDHNVKRNEYNEMLEKKYEGKEPILDIAKIQSTFPDGSRCSFMRYGKKYYSMVPEYTHDGAHLNELGCKKVAEQFLILLANLN